MYLWVLKCVTVSIIKCNFIARKKKKQSGVEIVKFGEVKNNELLKNVLVIKICEFVVYL